eukprot:240360_1
MSKRKKKDKNAPKRPLSAYFIFMGERRAIVRQKYGNKSMTDISKLLAKEWRSLSLVNRSKYLEKAAKLKEDYKIRLEEYKRSNNYKNYENKINETKKQMQTRSKKNIRKPLIRNNSNNRGKSSLIVIADSVSRVTSTPNTTNSKKATSESKQNVLKTLKTMGFASNFIDRAVKKYEQNHNGSYNIQNITNIIIGMQKKDMRIISSVNNSFENNNSNNVMKCKQENKRLKNEINVLKKRLKVLECSREEINRMNLDELNELKKRMQNTMQNKIQFIEEAEKKIMDNTYKCVACMDNLKNISFDECS